MRKKVVCLVGLALFLTGCTPLNGRQDESEQKKESLLEVFDQAVDEAKKDSSEAKEKTKESTTASSSSTAETVESSAPATAVPTEPTIDKNSYPFGVSMMDITAIGVFSKTGMNIPQTIMLSFVTESSGTVALVSNGGRTEYYTAQYKLIPTTAIRVFSAGSNDVRTVNVNTEIVIDYLAGSHGGYDAGNFYVFTNSSGTLSLATPNYAGNVMATESDVMLEYLP